MPFYLMLIFKFVGMNTHHRAIKHVLWSVFCCVNLLNFVCFPIDIQRRIELIQDFEMPTVCTSLKVSRDGQYILAAGKTWRIYALFYNTL